MIDKILLYMGISLVFTWDIFDSLLPEGSLVFLFIILVIKCFKERKIKYSVIYLIVLVILLIHSVFNLIFENTTLFSFSKQLVGITISWFAFLNLCNSYSSLKLIKMYYRVSFYIAIFGIIQNIAWLIKIPFIYDLSWIISGYKYSTELNGLLLRTTSICGEPAALAMGLLPAVYLSIKCLFQYNDSLVKNKLMSLIILICFISTFSSLGYIGLGISMLFIIIKSKLSLRKIMLLMISVLAIVYLYRYIPGFKMKLDDTVLGVLNSHNHTSINLSSYTLVENMKISLQEFFQTWGVGSGIGSYGIISRKYVIGNLLNADDANSMFLRCLAELGILGVFSIIYFIYKYYVKRQRGFYTDISTSIVVLFLIKLLRQGHYFHGAFYFFVVLYIINYKEFKFITCGRGEYNE